MDHSLRKLSRGEARGLRAGDQHYSTYVGPADRWDFMGASQFRLLAALGLREHHFVLDVGCGSLRAGRLLIPYLNRSRYCGIEPNSWLVEDGIAAEIGPGLVALKNARFSESRNFEAEVFGELFDFILAQSIFSHAGPDMLLEALPRFKGALAAGGLVVATFLFDLEHPRLAVEKTGWTYPGSIAYRRETIGEMASAAGFAWRIIPWYHPSQTWVVFASAPENLPATDMDRHLSGAVLREPQFAASLGAGFESPSPTGRGHPLA